jgi:hypothetical protein
MDLDNEALYYSKNGTFQNSGDPTSGATGTGAISITEPECTTMVPFLGFRTSAARYIVILTSATDTLAQLL